MKKPLLLIGLSLALGSVIAQDSNEFEQELSTYTTNGTALVVEEADTSWKSGGLLGLNASQTFLNDWAAGGQSSISGTIYANLFKNYEEGEWLWTNNLNVSYGLLNNGIVEGNTVKIDDKIDFRSKAGKSAFKSWYYTAELAFLSQWAPGYEVVNGAENKDNKISDLFAPAFLNAGLGMTYKPNDKFIMTIAPIATKNTIVNDGNSNLRPNYGFGDDLERSVRSEFGGSLGATYKRALSETAEYQTNLFLFSNYANNPGNVDMDWEHLLAFKLVKHFNINLIAQLKYDDDITVVKEVFDQDGNQVLIDDDNDPETPLVGQTRQVSKLQFREVFGLGFTYKF